MPKAVLYHNPRCSKSREALNFVKAQIEDLEVIEYLKDAPNKSQLEDIYRKLDIQSAHQMIRPKETEFKEAGLSDTSSDDEVLSAVAAYPKLLERPILVYKERAAIGRPLDHIVSLLHD